MKAWSIFMLLLSFVIFDAVSPTLLPVQTHAATRSLRDPRIIELDETTQRRDAQMEIPYSSFLSRLVDLAILSTNVSSSPTAHWTAKRERGRAPPLRV
jgi:hypothetical protein